MALNFFADVRFKLEISEPGAFPVEIKKPGLAQKNSFTMPLVESKVA